MTKEKINAPEACKKQACKEVLNHLMELLLSEKDGTSNRTKLNKMYICWLRKEGKDYVQKEEIPFFNLYYRIDRLLELTEQITPEEFNNFLCSSKFLKPKKV